MDLQLSGKNVFVSGSTSGIGLSIAKAFISEGCNVIINGRDQEKLEKVCSELNSKGLMADLTTPSGQVALENFFKEETIDILIANLGSGSSVVPGSENLEEWRRVFDINLFATTSLVEKLYPKIAENKGNIVCVSSICGIEALGAPITYSAAKAALNSFVKGFSRFCGLSGVRINAIAPGNILFDGSVWDRKLKEDSKQVKKMLQDSVPLQRLGRPEEVADLACYIASEKASFMTGEVIVLDGGQLRSF